MNWGFNGGVGEMGEKNRGREEGRGRRGYRDRYFAFAWLGVWRLLGFLAWILGMKMKS